MLQADRQDICQGPLNLTKKWARAILEKSRTCLDFEPSQEWKDR
jgi:hypothetical protein